MAERTLGSSIFATRQAASEGRDSSQALVQPPGNFPSSNEMVLRWGEKWEIWQAKTLDPFADDIRLDDPSKQNVGETISKPVADIGRRGC